MRLSLSTVAVAVLATCSVAYADSYFPSIQSTGDLGSRTLTQDTTTDLFSRADLIGSGVLSTPSDTGGSLDSDRGSYSVVISSTDGTPLLGVYLPTSALQDYAGSSICTLTSNCSETTSTSTDETEIPISFEAEVVAMAPEPPSMILLATGLLGMLGLLHRRLQGARE